MLYMCYSNVVNSALKDGKYIMHNRFGMQAVYTVERQT